MNTEDIQNILLSVIEQVAEENYEECDYAMVADCEDFENAEVMTFDDAQYLTEDAGLVLTLANGQEFQIAIRSRNGIGWK